MNRKSAISRKAVFLLIVFLLNTVVGFACSVGMGMGAVKAHHHDARESKADHHHHKGEHDHHASKGDHHHSSKEKKTNGDCCTDQVQKIEKTDKLSPPVLEFSTYQPFYTLIFPNYVLLEASVSSLYTLRPKYFVRDEHPPIPDIRIALQSFQI
ncbi:hypothetical protein DBR43_05460 [Pedobacter sp. KBW06]|uniref:hypothetical protein n=1 Tax=Pedobacter sp. KBW06 TaxID=2153359 RepID=UPI000F5A53B1|nr:hypothetical protein [Pedobacter sp. KBW06]RQO74829.1 hypothetical protein DBR43_05460 [Pedobacter sp. KBW06]